MSHVTNEHERTLMKTSRYGSNFSSCLATRLRECCRKHLSLRSATPAKTATNVGAGAASKREDSFSEATCLFNSKEGAGEAIIDTVASRAIMGEDRAEGLVDSLPKDLRSMVYRARTPGVTFKFGNSSKLTSRYAILLPRRQNGWIRVEVVPGKLLF